VAINQKTHNLFSNLFGRDRKLVACANLVVLLQILAIALLGFLSSHSIAEEIAEEIQTNKLYKIIAKPEGRPAAVHLARILAEDDDGAYLIEEQSGQQQLVSAVAFGGIQATGQPFQAWTKEQVAEDLLARFPKGFKTYSSKHFVIVYNTTDAYAKWNAVLFERLHKAFYAYWKRFGAELHEPEFPLVSLIFESRNDYLKYAAEEKVLGAENMIGFYSMQTNRIATYDLTGIEGMIPDGHRVSTSELVNVILRQPAAERSVATVVHEAVHQISFNSGLQQRLALHNPVAISEGLAMYFEAPDLRSSSGWGGIGNVNRHSLARFRQYLQSRPPNSLITLIQDDTRFQNAQTVSSAYGEAWALSFFLAKTRGKEFAAYLADLAARPLTTINDDKQRISDFQKHFGTDLEKLDREFLKFIARQ